MGERPIGPEKVRSYVTWVLGAFVFSLVVLPIHSTPGQGPGELQLHLLPQDPHAIATLFAPLLVFSSSEGYYPVPIETMLENADLKRDAEVVLEAPVSAEELGTYTSPEFYLDLRDSGPGLSYPTPSSASSATVYARVSAWSDGILLQYWSFYLYNEGLNRHEGDWEVVSFYLDGSGRPELATFSQHYTALVRHWTNVERVGGHPVVYVARGSHASYFAPGQHGLRSTPCGLTGLDSTTALTGPVPELPEIELLTDQPWLAFGGLWGEASSIPFQSGSPGPRFREDGCGSSLWSPPAGWIEGLPPDEPSSLVPHLGSPPVPSIHVSGSMVRGEPLTFLGHDSTDDGEIIYSEWELGDGTVRAGTDVVHTYGTTGEYTVGLAAMDNDGNLNATRLQVSIADGPVDGNEGGPRMLSEDWFPWVAVIVLALSTSVVLAYALRRVRRKRRS